MAGIGVNYVLYHTLNNYFTTLTIVTVVFITLMGGPALGIFFSVLLTLAADYFFIPPIGSVLENAGSVEHFLIVVVLTLTVAFLVSTLRDALHQAERARQEAERARRAREEVLAVVSHDLRTPLTSIRLSNQLSQRVVGGLEKGPLRDRLEKANETIQRSTQNAQYLIDDLLDNARIEAGTLAIEREPLDAIELLREVCAVHLPVAERKGIDLLLNLGEFETKEIGVRVLGDRRRINQVLSNLLGNAIKFVPYGGHVRISVWRERSQLVYEVADDGPGIREEDIPRLFDRYWKGNATRADGAGLGLAIAKGIIEAHGGRIWVEPPREGEHGARFRFTVPIAPASILKPDKEVEPQVLDDAEIVKRQRR